ncbi:MAG TPA: acyltransferase family protein, partial [Nitrospirota bacterium]
MLNSDSGIAENNFNLLRFAAASCVMINHTFILSGLWWDPYVWLSKYDALGPLAVNIFFVISGFLITKSWIAKPQLPAYFKKRALRILPALAGSTLLCVIIIGPLVTSFSPREYFGAAQTYGYLKNTLIFGPLHNNLPGVFTKNLFPCVNGTLWTLPMEVTGYILIAAFGLTGLF